MTFLQPLVVLVLGSLLAVAASGCAADDGFPDPPFFRQCISDEECAPLYECVGGRDSRVCTRACTTVSDCPELTSSCGAHALCTDGFCNVALCL